MKKLYRLANTWPGRYIGFHINTPLGIVQWKAHKLEQHSDQNNAKLCNKMYSPNNYHLKASKAILPQNYHRKASKAIYSLILFYFSCSPYEAIPDRFPHRRYQEIPFSHNSPLIKTRPTISLFSSRCFARQLSQHQLHPRIYPPFSLGIHQYNQ